MNQRGAAETRKVLGALAGPTYKRLCRHIDAWTKFLSVASGFKIGNGCTPRECRSQTTQWHHPRAGQALDSVRAKGAVSVPAWGDAPGFVKSKEPRSAESAIQSGTSSVVDQIETHFQRSCLHRNLKSWGDAPGSEMNAAPLALQVSSVKTLGYYHGSSSSLPARMFLRISSRTGRSRPSSAKSASICWSHAAF